MIKSKSIIATPPGATIKEQLEDRNMTQKEFAKRMGMCEKHISNLVNGDVKLTPEVAIRLESVLGLPAAFWNKLEARYQEKSARAIAENNMTEDLQLIKNFPYNEIKKLNWIPDAKSPIEKVENLRKFFEVFKLSVLGPGIIPGIAYRQLNTTEKNDLILITWAQKAKLEARSIETKDINIEKLKNSIHYIREMTTQPPEVFCKNLVRILTDCGIAVVFLPHIKGSFLHGATFYDGKKIVMGLTVRGKDADKFWFSLFHELAHILYGHIGQPEGTNDKDEEIADKFARDVLIPEEKYNAFIKSRKFSKYDVVDFAHSVNIDPGIVVGRLQKENFIDYNQLNDLKVKYIIKD